MKATWGLAHRIDFLAFSTLAESRAESERTYLGLLWWLVEPAISLVVYFVVFEIVLDRGGPNFVLFLFVGLIPWRWLSASIEQGGTSLLNSRALMQLVYVPKVLFPIRILLSNTLKFIPVLGLVVVVLWIAGHTPSIVILYLPIVILVQGALICGCVLVIASIMPLVPDLRLVTGNLLRLWLFLSGVFFDVGILDPKLQSWFRLNPMTEILEAYRSILLEASTPTTLLVRPLLAAFVLICLGNLILRKLDHTYPKIV